MYTGSLVFALGFTAGFLAAAAAVADAVACAGLNDDDDIDVAGFLLGPAAAALACLLCGWQ
jgi:hypothetical protein